MPAGFEDALPELEPDDPVAPVDPVELLPMPEAEEPVLPEPVEPVEPELVPAPEPDPVVPDTFDVLRT
jgi:hypothetical protein